ncbi:MAG: glycosyltransferase family 2 protein [Candidatus Poribacteria bacterium]
MTTLGVAIITKNEEKNIIRCLSSVSFADDKIIIDSHSTDRTVEFAKQCGARVIVRDFQGYSKEKQYAMDQLNTDWILALDADEILSPELQIEIRNTINSPSALSGYNITRHQVFLGRILRYGRGVDYHMRLFRRGKGCYDGKEAHEVIILDGVAGRLNGVIIHVSSPNISDRMRKICAETDNEMQFIAPMPITKRQLFINPIIYFISYMIKKSTWKDGIPGIIMLIMFCFQFFFLNARIYESYLLKNKKTEQDHFDWTN